MKNITKYCFNLDGVICKTNSNAIFIKSKNGKIQGARALKELVSAVLFYS
jgi:hypothetical protein